MSAENKIKEASDMDFENLKLSVRHGIEKIRSMSDRCREKAYACNKVDPEWEALADAYGDAVKIMKKAAGVFLR